MASRILVVFATITMVLAGLGVWVARQALDTDQWVDTSSALVADPDIQETTAAYLSDQLVREADVTARVQSALPAQLTGLAGPITGFIGQAANQAALRALQSGAFQKLWADAQRRSHEQLVNVIDGSERRVYLDLRPMLGQVAVRVGLGPTAVQKIESQTAVGRVEVLNEKQVHNIRFAGRALRGLAWIFTLLAIALFTASVWVAHGRRRRALLGAGVGIAVAGLTLLALRRVFGHEVVTQLTDGGASQPAAQSTWDITTSLLRAIAGSLVVLGVMLIAAAWFAGPSRWATRARTFVTPTLIERPEAVYAGTGIVLLIVLLLGFLPASGRLLGLVIYTALAFGGMAALRRQVIAESTAASGGPADSGSAPASG